jgi:hypothetical protein
MDRLTENIQFTRESVVPGEAVIRGVKILGRESKNRHPKSGKPFRYSDKALSGFATLQEGARVYINHKEGDDLVRGYEEQIGDVRNVTAITEGGPRDGTWGDLYYNPKHPLAEQFAYDAEHAPHRLGLSHVAAGRGKANDTHHLVEEAVGVFSVDVVDRPATNVSLFESETTTRKGVIPMSDLSELTLEQLKESRPDLVEALTPAPETDLTLVESLQKEITELRAENSAAKVREKRAASVEASRLPKEAVSETFLKQLLAADDETADALIKDRETIWLAQAPRSRAPQADIQPLTEDSFLASLGA